MITELKVGEVYNVPTVVGDERRDDNCLMEITAIGPDKHVYARYTKNGQSKADHHTHDGMLTILNFHKAFLVSPKP